MVGFDAQETTTMYKPTQYLLCQENQISNQNADRDVVSHGVLFKIRLLKTIVCAD